MRGLAWRIDCDHQLQVTIAVIDSRLFLHSNDRTVEQDWRVGIYMDAAEAARRAVEMTSSYERLRHGKVGEYAEVFVPEPAWRAALASDSEVDGTVSQSITDALLMSPMVSPEG